eukprot:TRINITY_DN28346_c0_g1_i1.p1 TRINITY_DN28346_c0_g1~~TRINITY_DN28346_c0_g1_i1.p1  ORF type:complete len:832 (-),score=177.03 TRINITY_DN28346_c0_g1_i1:35-2449(-)
MVEELGITQSVQANLCDKSADRRKTAAKDIERAVLTLVKNRSTVGGSVNLAEAVARLIRFVVDDFCRSAFPARRKGGLIALASMAIALEYRLVQTHVSQLLPPVLDCFSDEEAGVRYNACEAFYNIAKVARGGVLSQFGAVFDGLCRLYADVDQSVRDGAQCVDRLVRDVVTESRDFSYADFIPMMTMRIRVLNPSVRQLVLGWIILLDSVPQVDMIVYLPQYLDGLFEILGSDNRDIRHSAEEFLAEVLDEIKASATTRPARARKAAADAAPTVSRCCHSNERRTGENYVRLRALHWLLELVGLQAELERSTLAASAGGTAAVSTCSGAFSPLMEDMMSPSAQSVGAASTVLLNATAPRWASSGLHLPRPSVSAVAQVGSYDQEGLYGMLPVLLTGALHCLDDSEADIRQLSEQANEQLRRAAHLLGTELPLEALVDAVLSAMQNNKQECAGGRERSESVLLKCLSWLQLLLRQCPRRLLRPSVRDPVVGATIAAVARSEALVATQALKLLAATVAASGAGEEVNKCATPPMGPASSPPSSPSLGPISAPSEADPAQGLLTDVCRRLFWMLSESEELLRKRGELAVCQLCDGVGAGRLYATLTRILEEQENAELAGRLLRVLHWTLLTSSETRTFRAQLRLDHMGFVASGILEAWLQRCPVCALGIALWLERFDPAAAIATRLATRELTEEQVHRLDELAGLLESPVFARVRVQLLEAREDPAPLRAILGVVALQPRDGGKLAARLDVVALSLLLDKVCVAAGRCDGSLQTSSESSFEAPSKKMLLARFDAVADAHGWLRASM